MAAEMRKRQSSSAIVRDMKMPSLLAIASLLACGVAFAAPPRPAATRDGIIAIEVDATDVDHRIFTVRERIPAAPGPLTVLYPQWIPGNHGPTGKPWLVAGLRFTAQGRELPWRRDPVDVFAFTVDVPGGASEVEVQYQYLSALQSTQGPLVFAPELFTLAWNYVVLYPAGFRADGLQYRASLRVPSGWQAASALTLEAREGDVLRYAPVSLQSLVDSPAWAGRFLKRIALDDSGVAHFDAFADLPAHLPQEEATIEPFRALMRQAQALFGAVPYRHYDFLLALHERIYGHGLEHLESTEIQEPPDLFTEWKRRPNHRAVFPHELVHAWVGKKHRPAGLATAHFNEPMDGSLLWVYEGETEYWGHVLAARSGLHTEAEARAGIALLAATEAGRAGRDWRNLQDTTVEPALHYERQRDWTTWQRSVDYYGEGAFMWLEVDARIRSLTSGAKSLDDFARTFHGAAASKPGVVTYEFEDVVAALQAVAPSDWRTFLRERLDRRGSSTAASALEACGWRLAEKDTPNEMQEAIERERGGADFTWSLGFPVAKDNTIPSVRWESPAFRAGLAGSTTLVAVNGHAYKPEILKLAVKEAAGSTAPIALLIRSGDEYRTVNIDYHGGLRYPYLERIEGKPDLLAEILHARTLSP
jgi:predicted metalloprotease with PDZ domain